MRKRVTAKYTFYTLVFSL